MFGSLIHSFIRESSVTEFWNLLYFRSWLLCQSTLGKVFPSHWPGDQLKTWWRQEVSVGWSLRFLQWMKKKINMFNLTRICKDASIKPNLHCLKQAAPHLWRCFIVYTDWEFLHSPNFYTVPNSAKYFSLALHIAFLHRIGFPFLSNTIFSTQCCASSGLLWYCA